MPLHVSRLARSICATVVPFLATVSVAACSAGAGAGSETTATESQAVTSAGAGILRSHVTRQNWHRGPGCGGHGGWDGAGFCHPRPFDFCPLFDSEVLGQDGGASCVHVTTDSCPDRVDSWDSEIVFDFASVVTSDCRFGQWGPPLLSDTDVVNYLNDLTAFTLQFMGCAEEGTTTPLTFGLIPSALEGHRFTTADLEVLAETYTEQVNQALADFGAAPLSTQQLNEIHAKLLRLALHVPNVVPSRHFTFSTCAPDAGDQGGVGLDSVRRRLRLRTLVYVPDTRLSCAGAPPRLASLARLRTRRIETHSYPGGATTLPPKTPHREIARNERSCGALRLSRDLSALPSTRLESFRR